MYASQLYFNLKRDFNKAEDYIVRAIRDFNGDITFWSAYFIQGLLRYQMGNLFGARHAFEKALYYNPTFDPAKKKLAEVNQVTEPQIETLKADVCKLYRAYNEQHPGEDSIELPSYCTSGADDDEVPDPPCPITNPSCGPGGPGNNNQ